MIYNMICVGDLEIWLAGEVSPTILSPCFLAADLQFLWYFISCLCSFEKCLYVYMYVEKWYSLLQSFKVLDSAAIIHYNQLRKTS